MYLEYFGLEKKPFGITPDTSLFYSGADRGQVLEAILYALDAGEGIIKVVGEVGSGKTMLSRMLTKQMAEETVFVFLLNPSIQAEQVLYAIAYDLGLEIEPSTQSIQVLHLLQKKLFELYTSGKKVVLVIDEAQQMPLETLEEIRLLSNLETETEKLLQIIMFGQPELDQHINTPQVRQLKERITYSFYLNPLTPQTVESYLEFRLNKAGHSGRAIFQPTAVKQLTKVSQGTLRRLNILADKALLSAFLEKSAVVEPSHVMTALSDSDHEVSKNRILPISAIISFVSIMLGVMAFFWFVSYEPVVQSKGGKQRIEQAPVTPVQADVPIKQYNSSSSLLNQRIEAFKRRSFSSNEIYALRLLSAPPSSAKLVEEFLNRAQGNVDIEHIFVQQLSNKTKDYVVYYQTFRSYSDAKKTLNELPLSLKQHSPYIVTLENI